MNTPATPAVGTAKARYQQLVTGRLMALERARLCSTLTIPTLIPPEGASSASDYPTPYQSLGARGVHNLASKLVLSILPPNTPNFRLVIDDYTLEKLAQREGARADVEKALNKVERAVMTDIETTAVRAPLFEACKHLLVAGNVLLYDMPDGGLKVFGIDRYVVKRDPSGNLLEAITCEKVTPLEVPEEHRVGLLRDDTGKMPADTDSIEVYTWVKRTSDGWTVHQEINNKVVPGTTGNYPLDRNAFLALRLIAVSGDDYGRSFVEEYLGDLESLEGLSKAIVQAAAVAAKIVFLVKPNATASPTELAAKESGEFAVGNPEDVSVLSLQKFNDFRVALEMRNQLIESLSFAFLLNSAVQRNGERVTAEEIRFVANELESGLGGIYSTMSQEFQLPFITRRMHQLERKGRLPRLPKGVVKPMITTGVDAIGRGNDLSKLKTAIEVLAPLGPEAIARRLNEGDFYKRVFTALGIDADGLVRSDEEVQQQDQAAQMQALIAKLGPNVINQAGAAMREGAMPAAPA